MNNNRLSLRARINFNANEMDLYILDRTSLIEKAKKLINGPSNYSIKDGQKFVISDNKAIIPVHRSKIGVKVIVSESGDIIQTFESYHECAFFFGVTHPTIANRIKNKTIFKAPQLDGKTVYLNRI